MTTIAVYPVGVLAHIRRAWRYLTLPVRQFPATHRPVTWRWRASRAQSELYAAWRTTRRHIRQRQWHELRQTFNGYLAEPEPFPDGLTRCGRGWTRRAAVRSLLHWAAAQCRPTRPGRDLMNEARRLLTEGLPK